MTEGALHGDVQVDGNLADEVAAHVVCWTLLGHRVFDEPDFGCTDNEVRVPD